MITTKLKPEVIHRREQLNRHYGKYKNKSLYDIAADVIEKYCELNHQFEDVIIKIKIGNTDIYGGEYISTEFVRFDGDHMAWEFDNDFDEGEDYIVITDICYLSEVFV